LLETLALDRVEVDQGAIQPGAALIEQIVAVAQPFAQGRRVVMLHRVAVDRRVEAMPRQSTPTSLR
jgi:hypothetical protein